MAAVLVAVFLAGAFLAGPSWPPSWRPSSWPAPCWPAPSWPPSWWRSSWPEPWSPWPSWPPSSWPRPSWQGLGRRRLLGRRLRGRGLLGSGLGGRGGLLGGAGGGFAPVAAAATVSLGSFFAPETTSLRSAPALNFGTAVFLALIRSPVARVADPARVTDPLLEGAEARDGDLLALGDLAGDGVEHRLERVSSLLAVALEASSEGVDQLTLVHKLPFREPVQGRAVARLLLGTLGKSRRRHNHYTRFSLASLGKLCNNARSGRSLERDGLPGRPGRLRTSRCRRRARA